MEFTEARVTMCNGQPRLMGVKGPIPTDELDGTMLLREGMDSLTEKIHKMSHEHGFWDHESIGNTLELNNPSIVPEKLALIHSEVSEALEAYRDGNPASHIAEELADIIIRVLDLAGHLGFSMDDTVREKMIKNEKRPRLHGKAF